jgi:two-component system nitrogen regulation sensor histidine kinase NtrY
MAVPVRTLPAPSRPPATPRRPPATSGRTPFRDNTRLLFLAVAFLVATLAGLLILATRSTELAPDFLTEFVLYGVGATDLAMLAALLFVLARNIVKLVVERRRALPFARFRAKLVAVLLGMTLIPAVLVLLVGSELIRNSVGRWFNAPMAEVLTSAKEIASDYYQEQQRLVVDQAQEIARALADVDLRPETVRDVVAPDVLRSGNRLVGVFRLEKGAVVPVFDIAAIPLPPGYPRDSAATLAARSAAGATDTRIIERIPGGGELIRTAMPIRGSASRAIRGVVVASEYLSGQFVARARRMTDAYEQYQQLSVLRQPLAAVYISFFLMLTLLILVAATWMGLYLAKRITRPVQMLAAAAREIGAGHLEHRVVSETADEFGSLVDAFNRMAGDLAASRRNLERRAKDVERKHQDVEGRRRYIETILERIATGVVSLDRAGQIGTVNAAAARLLGISGSVVGLPASVAFGTPELRPLATLINEALVSRTELRPQEVAITHDGRELHLAVTTTPLQREDGMAEGVVLVFDDVTPLIRTQKVSAWREVARRLAHEIKNPLTPIQLCAERLRRHFAGANDTTRQLVDECTTTIVGEVESLKGLVDEFSQFARMPVPRAVPTDLLGLLNEALSLYDGIFSTLQIRRDFQPDLPTVSVDPEQIRRVIINLLDNAIEAMEQRGAIDVEARHDRTNNLVRIIVADHGPGIPTAEREKLFLPYYSTKRRGSGLGLAIVRRIVAEHGGSIDVSDNTPTGTRFAIELPC